MKRVVVALMLTILFLMSSLPSSYGRVNPLIEIVDYERISAKFFGKFDFYSNEFKQVIVVFNKPPVLEYRKSFAYKLLSFVNRNEADSYEAQIQSFHEKFSDLVSSLGGETRFSFSYTVNAVACKVKGTDIKGIANFKDVSGIFEDNPVYLERTTLTKVIQSDVVNKMKDSSNNYITGKGVVVGIVDTGVDYTDKELGGGNFPNSKVIGGYDFADDDADPKDSDGHGTHVAGIIAGSVDGIAPDAKIRAYKVFSGNDNSTSTSTIIQGIEQAVKDKCNIINISIGTVGGQAFGDDPQSLAVRNAVGSGVVVVAAAGNKGSRSDSVEFPLSSPASVDKAIGVGATDDSITGVITSGNKQILANYPPESPFFNDGNYDMVYCGLGEPSDFQGKDVKGKIAFIERGKIYFGDKDLNAKSAGAIGLIVYNDVSGIPSIQLSSESNPQATGFIPFLFVSFTDGQTLKENLSLGIYIQNKYGLGRIADFSSDGPTSDLFLKPDLVAPGVNVSSTLPADKVGVMSGTSMASPVVAGVSALLKQWRPNISPDDAKALLMNSSDVLINPYSGLPFSPLMQGAGRINALNAINSNYFIKPSSVIFGNGDLTKSVTFTVTNLSSNAKTFFTSYQMVSNDKISINLPFIVSVPVNGTATFTANFSALKESSEAYGYIYLKDSSSINLHIPFVYIANASIQPVLNNVKISGTGLTPQNNLVVQFTVGIGQSMSDDNSTFNGNVAEEVKVDVYDFSGKLIDTIFDQAPIYVGDYSANLSLMDLSQDFKYDNGTYYYKVEYIEATVNEGAKIVLPTEVTSSSSGTFTVSQSPSNTIYIVPQNNFTLLLKNGNEFWLDVYVDSLKLAGSLNFNFNFDPYHFAVSECQKGKSLADDINFTSDIQNGVVKISLTSETSSFTNKSVIASLKLKALDNGSGFVGVSSVQSSQLLGFVLPQLYYNISDYSHFFDLNNDNAINNLDLNILKASFLKKKGDTGYNASCDLNFDGIISSIDFFMLAKHYGEKYP